MTADQIEARVEKMIDHLDRMLLAGRLDEKAYDGAMRELRAWEEAELAWSRSTARWRARNFSEAMLAAFDAAASARKRSGPIAGAV